MKYYLFAVALSLSFAAVAQQEGNISVAPGRETRSQYIKSYPDKFFIWPVLKQRKLDFDLKNVEGEEQTLQYRTNKPYSLGVGMYLFELGFEIAFAIPLDEQSKRIYGESESRDVQLNVLGRRWGADLFYQRYSGFYIDDTKNVVPASMPYPQRPDIITRNLGLSVNRIFNHNKFSFRSAYNFVDRQLTSAGSFIVFASFDNILTKGDSAIIGSAHAENFQTASQVRSIRSSNLGVAPGYTYSLIYKGFFINGTLAIGPAHNWMTYELEDGTDDSRLRFSAMVTARIALGYNGDRIFGGLTFSNQGRNVKFENVQLSNSQSAFKILVGYRFGETGILTKRIWDIPQKLFN